MVETSKKTDHALRYDRLCLKEEDLLPDLKKLIHKSIYNKKQLFCKSLVIIFLKK
jgi:hypothetical protein